MEILGYDLYTISEFGQSNAVSEKLEEMSVCTTPSSLLFGIIAGLGVVTAQAFEPEILPRIRAKQATNQNLPMAW